MRYTNYDVHKSGWVATMVYSGISISTDLQHHISAIGIVNRDVLHKCSEIGRFKTNNSDMGGAGFDKISAGIFGRQTGY